MRQGLKRLITWARMPRLSKQYLPSLCDMCINEQGKTSKSVWDKGPVHFHLPPRKKEKKDQTVWKLKEMKPLHELSQTRTSWPRSQRVRSALSILHKGFWDRDTFPNRVGDRWKKEWEGRRKRKYFLHVPSPHPNLSKPKSNMVAQWMILSSRVRHPCWKKVFGVFVKGPTPHKKRQLNIFVWVRQ